MCVARVNEFASTNYVENNLDAPRLNEHGAHVFRFSVSQLLVLCFTSRWLSDHVTIAKKKVIYHLDIVGAKKNQQIWKLDISGWLRWRKS